MATRIGETLPAGQNLFRKPIQRPKLPKAQDYFRKLKRSPLRKQSKRRQGESKIYLVKRKQFLEEHPFCQVTVQCPTFAPSRSCHVHHRELCGKNYLVELTWLASCETCHSWIHDHPNQARELGLLK